MRSLKNWGYGTGSVKSERVSEKEGDGEKVEV
jgi:hypothetical protein